MPTQYLNYPLGSTFVIVFLQNPCEKLQLILQRYEWREGGCPGVIGCSVDFLSAAFSSKVFQTHKWAISLPTGVPLNWQDAKNLQG